ncbi:MAG: tyrosine-type recombinase/integrase [Oscillospiraceae bacterium]|nr:tyrosine-type recombinase/integrase [Oscillospiraceae bacterium]
MKQFEAFPDLMTVPEAAEALRVSASVVEELIKNREITYVAIGETKLVRKSDLTNYVEKQTHLCYDASTKMHLDNSTEADLMPLSEGESDMANRINQAVMINGKKCWVTAKTAQEFADKVANLLTGSVQQKSKHPFSEYAWNWFNTYSLPNIATVTAVTYRRQIEKYLIPTFGELAVEDITSDHVQQMFNKMHVAKATKDKTRTVLNQILEAALEDKLIDANPVKSRKVKVVGDASKATPPYSVEQMEYLIEHLEDVKNNRDRAFLAVMALHPLRLEEGLGLKGADINRIDKEITIRRAVTHPDRNQPEIKDTKNAVSRRTIGLAAIALAHIPETPADEFVFGGKKPLSYTVVRRMCQRIQKDTGFEENITPIRFRTTVLTDMYDVTKDLKAVMDAGGHAQMSTSVKHYIKGRQTIHAATDAVERRYTSKAKEVG